MGTFKIEEVIALFVIVGLVISILGFLIKGCFKAVIGIFIGAVIFGFGFGWLPQQIASIKNGDKTKNEVINETFTSNTLQSSLNTSKDYYDKNKNSLFSIVESAFSKVGDIIFPAPAPSTNNTTTTK